MTVSMQRKKILVIGDMMIDKYEMGSVSRISPEAPVPVFLKKGERYVLGGASNVIANLIAAGQEVTACSVLGDDGGAELLISRLESIHADCGLIQRSASRKTTLKTRILGQNNQQMLRIDEETTAWITDEQSKELAALIEARVGSFDAVILSDYCKGVLSETFCRLVISLANQHGVPVLIDVKDQNIRKYEDAFLLKPNLLELKTLTGMSVDGAQQVQIAAKALRDKARCKYVLTTMGGDGMLLTGAEENAHMEPAIKREVFDVSGAGDTAISYLTVGLVSGMGLEEAVHLANVAAGLKVTKQGTSPVYLQEVAREIEHRQSDDAQTRPDDRIFYADDCAELIARIDKWQADNETVVTTNGCFDILHRGHVALLQRAAALGDHLIVAINSDESVKRLKGSDRPLNNELDRAFVLSAIAGVDAVVIFDPHKATVPDADLASLSDRLRDIAQEAPMGVIKALHPDVHAKGGDYSREDVPEALYAKRFAALPFIDGYSTTNTLNQIKTNARKG